MEIAITGGTGFLGTALRHALDADGHRVRILSRRADGPDTIHWDPARGELDPASLRGVDAVVHLAGEGIASRPWSAAQRERLRTSRTAATRLLVDALGALPRPPSVLVGASAVGWYGDRGDEVLEETSASGDDFLADLCRAWEAEAERASALGVRTVRIRTGIVLDARGGALAKQLPAYRLGLGAQAGDGSAWIPWISLHDHVAAVRHLLGADVSGPVNLTGPAPVRNRDLTRAVGRALGRPTFLRIPRLVTRLPLGVGPLVESLLFASQRAMPAVLDRDGFAFRHETIDAALADVLARR